MPLSDAQLRNLKPAVKPRKLSDGGGLHILVTSHGSKLWRMAYRYGGKQKLLSFGSYPAVSLSAARERREAAKRHLAAGNDPSEQIRRTKAAKLIEGRNTFEAVAAEVLDKAKREGNASMTLRKKRWIIDMANRDIGKLPITEITASDVLVPLRKIELVGNYETARRMRSLVGQVFRYAISVGLALNDPTFGLKGALVTPRIVHRAALTDWKSFAGMIRAIWDYDGAIETRCALRLMALLYPRPGELRQAGWNEFDLEQGVWTIPATRSKMRREHRKPLPSSAVAILTELCTHSGNRAFVFPSVHKPQKPLSENTLNASLRRLGYTKDEATSHGFRATASTLLNESGKWSPDAIEAELGHLGADEVRRAYHRALYWEERAKMADWWADRIESCLQIQ